MQPPWDIFTDAFVKVGQANSIYKVALEEIERLATVTKRASMDPKIRERFDEIKMIARKASRNKLWF